MTRQHALMPDATARVPANNPRLSTVARGAVLVHVLNPHAPRLGARYVGSCEGMTVDQAIEAAGWKLPWHTILVRGSERKTRQSDWAEVIGRDELVILITQPRNTGGGTSQILATVASIALAIAAPGIGGLILGDTLAGTAFLGAATYGNLATVGVLLAGSTLISALLPHPAPFQQSSATQSPTYALSAQSNQARLLQVKSERFGRFRFLPDLAAAAYFDFSASQQNIYEEFDLGMGEFDIEEMGVANNPIFKKSLISEDNPDGYTDNYPEIELQIVPPGQPQTLFPNNVVTSADISNIQMVGSNEDGWDWIGPFVTNPATTQASRLAFDISLPAGLFKQGGDGKATNATVSFEIQAEPIDDVEESTGDRVSIIAQTLTMATRDAVRTTIDTAVTPGRYRVWFRRTNDKSTDPNTIDTLMMLAMRAFMPGVTVRPNSTVVALKARSTKNLNGSSAQQFYVVATRKLPLYDPEAKTWSASTATRSIAAAASYILRSQNGLRKPDSKIDLQMLWAELHPVWEGREDYFDGTFDTRPGADDALQTVLRCGRAERQRIGRYITFNRDQPKTVPRTAFSPLNMVAGSFSIDHLMWDASALDAVWIDYVDERNWQPASIFCALPDSTVSPNDAPRIQWLGITNRAHAWREGMFLVAANRYRRIFPAFSTELDGRLCQRGDLVPVTHWVRDGAQAASVIALSRFDDGDVLTLDQPWEPPDGVSDDDPNMITMTTPDGRVYGPITFDVVEDGADTGFARVKLTQTFAVTVGRYIGLQPRDWPQFTTNGTAAMEWPKATYGVAKDHLDALVVSMTPQGQDKATVATVVDDPRVHTADVGDPPDEVNPPTDAVADDLTISSILIGEVAGESPSTTQINIVIVGAADAISFDVSLCWDEAPDVVDLVDQPRQSNTPGQAGTLVVSARAVGASGIGPWFTPGAPFEATGVPQGDAPDTDTPLTGVLEEVTL